MLQSFKASIVASTVDGKINIGLNVFSLPVKKSYAVTNIDHKVAMKYSPELWSTKREL